MKKIPNDYEIPCISISDRTRGGRISSSWRAFEVSEDVLSKLDLLEGVPDHYYRKTIEIINEHKIVVDAECYFARDTRGYVLYNYIEIFIDAYDDGLIFAYLDEENEADLDKYIYKTNKERMT